MTKDIYKDTDTDIGSTAPDQTEEQAATAIMQAAAPQGQTVARQPIGEEEVKEAYQTLLKYQRESQAIRHRIMEDQQYYEFTATSGRSRTPSECKDFQESVSAYLFNSIANKHADFMDNMPAPTILPQEESDQETAKLLTDIVPTVFEASKFQKRYSRACYDKLIGGTALYSVMWDGAADNGLGQIRINNAEIMNLYWQGGISDLEDSPNLFYVSVENNDRLLKTYPQLEDSIGNGVVMALDKFVYEDEPDTTDRSLVIDWYYKRPTVTTNATGERVIRNVLHYCCFCNGKVLYASENETDQETGAPKYPNGFYEHGRYPYVMDPCFPLKGTPAGFGYVDVMKSPQEYIDKLDTCIRENAEWCAEPHYFVPTGAGINVNDIREKKQFINVSSLTDQIKPLQTQSIDSNVLNVRTMKTDELKETSGNTDFSQGTTTSGVTAASAIAALQEAGSKLSRDMIKNSYEVYADLCWYVIELMRQFYTVRRVYRITQPNNEYVFEDISAADLGGRMPGMTDSADKTMFGMAIGGRKPYFDIKVDAQKASPFSKAAQNELALQLYGMGFFNPELGDQSLAALDMMQFEGKEALMTRLQNNQQLLIENTQLKQAVVQLTQLLAQSGDETSAALANALAEKYGTQDQQAAAPATAGEAYRQTETDSLGSKQSTDNIADRAKKQTQDRTEVR